MPYRFTHAFARTLRKKPPTLQAAILECVHGLMNNEGHPGLRTHKMQGIAGVWEAYVDKGNRVTFERDGSTLVFRANCNHDILRNP